MAVFILPTVIASIVVLIYALGWALPRISAEGRAWSDTRARRRSEALRARSTQVVVDLFESVVQADRELSGVPGSPELLEDR